MSTPDGSVIINTKINTDGVDDGEKEIKEKLNKVADAADGCADQIEDAFENLDVSGVAEGLGEKFVSEGAQAERVLDDMADAAEKAAEEQAEAMHEAWQETKSESSKASKEVIDDLDDIGDQAKETGKNVEGILAGFVGGIASGVTQKGMDALKNAGEAVVEFGKEATELGSDLQEVQNVVDVTFTTMSDKVNEFAKSADASAGLSETMAKEYAGTFGTMAKSMGFAEAEAYELSTALTQFTGDLASFRNLSQDEAFTKLQAIFTGETESLKALGVVMTQTNLDAFALANGFGKTTDAMTEQEKVSLRYQYVMDQLSAAQGDFVRTQDSWANQTKALDLQLENLKNTVGEGLIGALSPTVQFINESTLPSLQALAETFANMFKATPADDFRAAMGDVQNAIDNANAEYNRTAAETELAASQATAFASELDKLTAQGLNTADAMSKAKAFVAELNKLIPDLNLEINEQTGLLSKNTKAINDSISAMRKKGMDEATINRLTKAQKDQAQATVAYEEAVGRLAVLEAEQEERRARLAEITDGYSERENSLAENLSAVNDYLTTGNVTLQKSTNLYGDLGKEIEQADLEIAALKKTMGESSAVIQDNQKIIDEWAAEAVEAGLEVSEAMDGAAESTKAAMEEVAGSAASGASGALSGTSDIVAGVMDELSLETDRTYGELTQGLENNADVIRQHAENLAALMSSGASDSLISQFTNSNNVTMAALNEAMQASNGQYTELIGNFNEYERATQELEQTISNWEYEQAKIDAMGRKSVEEVWAEYQQQSLDWIESRTKLINTESDKAKSEARSLVNEAEKLADEASEYFSKSYKAKEEGNLALADKYRQMAVQKQREARELLAEAQRLFGSEGTAGIIEDALKRVEGASQSLSGAVEDATSSISDNFEEVIGFLEEETGISADRIREIVFSSREEVVDAAKEAGDAVADASKEASDEVVDNAEVALDKIQGLIWGLDGTEVVIDIFERVHRAEGYAYEYAYDSYDPQAYSIPYSVPYLAEGAVIPPNAPFMAVLGDQRHGTNLEAPADLIRQIVREEMEGAELGGDIRIEFGGDLAGLASILAPVITREQRRNSRAGGN